jgi:hypothetical protein
LLACSEKCEHIRYCNQAGTLFTWRSVRRIPGDRMSRLSGGRDGAVRFEWLRGRDMEYSYDTVNANLRKVETMLCSAQISSN